MPLYTPLEFRTDPLRLDTYLDMLQAAELCRVFSVEIIPDSAQPDWASAVGSRGSHKGLRPQSAHGSPGPWRAHRAVPAAWRARLVSRWHLGNRPIGKDVVTGVSTSLPQLASIHVWKLSCHLVLQYAVRAHITDLDDRTWESTCVYLPICTVRVRGDECLGGARQIVHGSWQGHPANLHLRRARPLDGVADLRWCPGHRAIHGLRRCPRAAR